MAEYFDSHTHLAGAEFEGEVEDVIRRALDAGVTRFLVPGGDMEESRRALELAERFDNVFAAVGVHPNAVGGEHPGWRNELPAMIASGKVYAIGETGLDLYRKRTPLDEQLKAFYYHLELAAEHGLPVVIHQRAAEEEMRRAITEFALRGGPMKGVMHCYSGSECYLECILKHDLFVSFAGPVTYPRNRKLRMLVPKVPEDRLLIETDAPYLPPQKHRGERNEPALLPEIAAKVAESLRLFPEDAARMTWRNAHRLLNLDVPGDTPAVVYSIRNSLYVNLTNRCNCRCVFCPASDGRFEIRGHNLRLEDEPRAEDVFSELEKRLSDGDFKEVVFCGLGEPTLRLDVLLDVASRLKRSREVSVRLDTNGLVALYEGAEAPARLAQVLDAVSVSLNSADPEQYRQLCRPEKEGAYEAALAFVETMRDAGLEVTVTAVKFPGVDVEAFKAMGERLGVGVRLREWVR